MLPKIIDPPAPPLGSKNDDENGKGVAQNYSIILKQNSETSQRTFDSEGGARDVNNFWATPVIIIYIFDKYIINYIVSY